MLSLFVVSPEEIERLSKRFKKLDLDNSGAISVTEFKTVLPELADNPLVSRVISIFDTDGNGELDFQGLQFVSFITCAVRIRYTYTVSQKTSPHF